MMAVAALLGVLPLAARAKPVGNYAVIVGGAGDKADPSIDAQFVVFSSDAGGDRDVLLYEIGAVPDGNVRTLAGGPGDQDQPAVHRTTLAYRSPAGIVVMNWQLGTALRAPPAASDPARRCQPVDAVSSPVVSDVLAAWVCGSAGARTVVVARYHGALEEYELASSGDVFGASVSGALVGYIDASDGSVWLHDSTPASRQSTRVAAGRATGVSVGDVGVPVVAVARVSSKPDADIEVWDPTGGLGTAGRIAALVVPGEQRNPHISGEWVAFEDLSCGVSQVVLWQWTTGLVFLPHPSPSNQTLNDLSFVSSSEVRVVFADDGDGTGAKRDIALYRLPYQNGTIPDDGAANPLPWDPTQPCTDGPRPLPATCDTDYPDDVDPCACHCDSDDDDGKDHDHDRGDDDRDDDGRDDHDDGKAGASDPRVLQRLEDEHHACDCKRTCGADRAHRTPVTLARLELRRHEGKPRFALRRFDATPSPGDAYLPVLVCVDVDHTTSGWLVLDDALLAGPSAFGNQVHHLEFRAAAHPPAGRIAGLIGGKPGARLVARVIADPGSYPAKPVPCPVNACLRPPGGTSGAGAVPVAPTPAAPAPAPAAEPDRIGGGGGFGCGTSGGAGTLGGLALVALLGLRRRRAVARG
jgi:hypothetical protein